MCKFPKSRGRTLGHYLLVIDADQLDSRLCRVDEKNFINSIESKQLRYQPCDCVPEAELKRAANFNKYMSRAVEYDSNWFNDVTRKLDTPEQVLRSLVDGSCAYSGSIPKSAFKKGIDSCKDARSFGKYFGSDKFETKASKLSKAHRWLA